jgi:hypothetical protein
MTVVLPRLDRTSALQLLERRLHTPVTDIADEMPDLEQVVTYSPVGGTRIDRSDLADLRPALLGIAREHGMPGPLAQTSTFEAKSARLIRQRLDVTPHEAAQEEVWSYLTCCWLLDVAVWRFGPDANIDRFIGHLNRNTFRRLWWRAEVFGPDIDLALLGEDELVNIMERPTLFSDQRLARSIALELIARTADGIAVERMRLMREATKRLLRLTPFVGFAALDHQHLKVIVADAFDAAAAGLAGASAAMPHRTAAEAPSASLEVTQLPRLEIEAPTSEPPSSLAESARAINFEDVAQAALDIAQRTGRVTNVALREVVPIISPQEARDVFRVLLERGDLVRRGVKRGTHYVLPIAQNGADGAPPKAAEPRTESVPPPQGPAPRPADRPFPRGSETALRRLLRRMR